MKSKWGYSEIRQVFSQSRFHPNQENPPSGRSGRPPVSSLVVGPGWIWWASRGGFCLSACLTLNPAGSKDVS